MNYPKAIRVARSLADMSQAELANRAGIDRSYLSLIESGKRQPTVDVIEKIAAALKLPFHLLSLLGSEERDVKKVSATQIEDLALELTKLLLQISDEQQSISEPDNDRPNSFEEPSKTRVSTRRRPQRTAIAR